MSYVKYREDDIKISNDRSFMRNGSQLAKKNSSVRYYDCKYCRRVLESKELLIKHIRESHNIVRPVVIINDKVIGDYAILRYIESAKILMYGFDGDVTVGTQVIKDKDNDEIDFTSILKEELLKNSQCNIKAYNTTIFLKFYTLAIESDPVIQKIIHDWQNAVSNGTPLDSSQLYNVDGSNRLFLEGIYNYYLGCSASHYKAKRYDDAFSRLSQFNDLGGIGKCILKAIAFRRNSIETLQLLSEGGDDIFSTAYEFYTWQSSSFDYEKDANAKQLFVEENTQSILEAIVSFQKGNYQKATDLLGNLGNPELLDDMNLIDQIYYLNARLALAASDRDNAIKYFNRLSTPALRAKYNERRINNEYRPEA